jgi:uncharacterized protein YkwD
MQRSRIFALLCITAMITGLVVISAVSSANATTSFTNFQLGNLPAEYCPDPNSPCQNVAAEPAIRADKFGNFLGASENGLTAGTEAWKSVDGGRHYVHLPSPNQLSTPLTGITSDEVSPAGGDVDVAIAPVKNEFGIYNYYVSSLELTSVNVSTSKDGGHTWSMNPASTHSPGDDREWIAADGQKKVCISYHDGPQNIEVDCSYDEGTTFTQPSSAIDAAHAYQIANNSIGNMAIDQNSNTGDPTRNNDIVYQSYSACPYGPTQNLTDFTNCTANGTYHGVFVGVSMDGGKTFVDHPVYVSPNTQESYGHQFVNVSVDSAGTVYVFYGDNHDIDYSYSKDHGTTWHGPYRITPLSQTSIFPWSVAGAGGKVDLVWYGSSYYTPGQVPDNYPDTASWYVYFAQNLTASSSPNAWSITKATPIVHYGGVCEGGISCTGNRDLYDDFGVAASPKTGFASIIYSDDQYNQYNHNQTYPSNCTQADNNTANCDHTSIATQTSGGRIYGTSATGTCSRTTKSDQAERDALSQVNTMRTNAGLQPLSLNATTSTEARQHSCDEDRHGDFDERGSDGSEPGDRIKGAGVSFNTFGENLRVVGTSGTTLQDAVDATLTHVAFTKNILNPNFRQVGIGAVYDNGVLWLTEDFTG